VTGSEAGFINKMTIKITVRFSGSFPNDPTHPDRSRSTLSRQNLNCRANNSAPSAARAGRVLRRTCLHNTAAMALRSRCDRAATARGALLNSQQKTEPPPLF